MYPERPHVEDTRSSSTNLKKKKEKKKKKRIILRGKMVRIGAGRGKSICGA